MADVRVTKGRNEAHVTTMMSHDAHKYIWKPIRVVVITLTHTL